MLEKLNIEVFSMREIDDLGIKEVSDKSFIMKYFSGQTVNCFVIWAMIYVPLISFIFIITNNKVARQALKKINPQFSRPLHVSFDIDVLDPSEAPATGTPGKS